MKSIALTLAVIFATMGIASAATEAAQPQAHEEADMGVEAADAAQDQENPENQNPAAKKPEESKSKY